MQAGDLGYCMAFNFKCAAARRCDAWIAGGPLTDELQQSMLPMAGDDDEDEEEEYKAAAISAPQWMQANAQRGLDWHADGKSGDGVTDKTLREARAMAAGSVSADKAMRMAAWFARHMGDLDAPDAQEGAKGYPSPGVVAHALWGGGSKRQSQKAAAWARSAYGREDEAKESYGGVERDDLKPSDFVLPGRKFPVMTAQDVRNAVSSWGRYEGPITFEEFKRRLIALAKRKGLTDALPQSWREEMGKNIDVQLLGSAVKALGNGKIGGYLIRFTDEASPDLTGDYFTDASELGTVESVPVLYHHGQDSMIGKRVLGKGTLRKDDIGLWVEAQLAMRDEYEASIYKLAEDGKLGWSSGAVSHLVEREQKTANVAWVKMWWVAEASLTPTPAEPRNDAQAIKSGEAATPEDAVKASASVATDDSAFENIEDTTMDNTNEIAELKASIAALTAQVNEPKVESGKAAAVVGALGGDHDGHKAFTQWLRTGQKNYYTRTESADYTKTGMTEGTGTAGGVLVPEGLYNQIVAKRDEQAIARRAGAMVIQTTLDSVQVPTENNKAAFVLRGEESAYTESLPTFTSRLVSIYNYSNLIKASNELLADQQASLDGFLINVLGRGLAQAENAAVVNGTGSSQPLGILAGGTAGITFAGAAALTIADVLGLFFALPEPYTAGSPGPVWLMKNATLALIRALTTTNFAFNQVEQAGSNQAGAMLYGYPVIVSAAMPAATTGLKSVSLVNFASSTVLVERAGLVVSRNPYLYEEYGQTAIFSTARFGFSVTTAEGAIYGTQA